MSWGRSEISKRKGSKALELSPDDRTLSVQTRDVKPADMPFSVTSRVTENRVGFIHRPFWAHLHAR